MYKHLIRPLLFRIDPEKIHDFMFTMFSVIDKSKLIKSAIGKIYKYENPKLNRKLFGLNFSNPVGLAAGLDKNAHAVDVLDKFGFGFIEIGTVTPKPQPGNPKKRLFRLIKNQAIINRMGFNNLGVEAAVEKLKHRNKHVIVGGNIGKNTFTTDENALEDYKTCFTALHPYIDYFVVNVSCPNVKNLRESQSNESLMNLLQELTLLNKQKSKPKPILLKISPDLTFEQLDDTLEIVEKVGIDGIVATNTTTCRDTLNYPQDFIESIGNGGLSGKPLSKRSTEIIRYIHKKTNGRLPIIGVGGIMSVEDALEKLEAGASLVQIYSGFIYEGPGFVKRINKAVLNHFCTK
jgi:dihydroorotate dehydrogenase